MFPEGRALAGGAMAQPVGWRRVMNQGENLLVAGALSLMVLVPLVEASLREFLGTGISGATAIVQHLVLVVGMLGGALAAREGRLLALSTVRAVLAARWKPAAVILSSAFAVAASFFLYGASKQYIAESSMRLGKNLAYGLPVWVVQLVLPLGFAVIGLRLLWRSSDTWGGRAWTFGLAAALMLTVRFAPFAPEAMVTPLLLVLVVAAVLGAPIFTVLGGAALILFWGQEGPIASVALDHYRMTVNPSLPAIPLFTLAGYFLAEGGASDAADPRLPCAGRRRARRAGNPDGAGVRVLHVVHGCFGRHDPRPRRSAHAGAAFGALLGAQRGGPPHGGRFTGPALPAGPAPDPLRRGGDVDRRQCDVEADVPRVGSCRVSLLVAF